MLRFVIVMMIVAGVHAPRMLHAGYDEGYQAASKGLYKVALAEFQKAAEKGDARAQYSLGVMYLDGIGTQKDKKEAMRWLKKAADQKHPLAIETIKGSQ